MTTTRKAQWRVYFEGAPAREVYASSEESARRTAEHAQRLVGFPRKACRAIGEAEFLWFVGYTIGDHP